MILDHKKIPTYARFLPDARPLMSDARPFKKGNARYFKTGKPSLSLNRTLCRSLDQRAIQDRVKSFEQYRYMGPNYGKL